MSRFDEDSYGRHYTAGAVSNNDASVEGYAAAVPGEPLERARRRAASVGPLANLTAGTPLWVINERKERS